MKIIVRTLPVFILGITFVAGIFILGGWAIASLWNLIAPLVSPSAPHMSLAEGIAANIFAQLLISSIRSLGQGAKTE